jgi:hypothetical protein
MWWPMEFDDWEALHRLPAVQAALDAVPDPVQGLLGRAIPRVQPI